MRTCRTNAKQLAEETAPQVVTQATKSTNASSTKATPSTESLAATPPIASASDSKMGSTKIRPFKGLRNGREDPSEYIEDLEWLHEQHYKANGPEPDKTLRLLFRQNLEDAAYDWYIDLEKETKNNWNEFRKAFLKAFEVTEKDAQAKKFELRMKIAQLRQEDKENIADYLKRAAELARKMVHDDIDVGMTGTNSRENRSISSVISPRQPSRAKKDLFGHYASTHNPPTNTDRPRQQPIAANAALPAAQATQDAEKYYPTTAACLLPVSGNAGAPVMIAQRPSAQPSKKENEEVEETVEWPSTFPVAQPSRSRQQPPPTRVTKTGKVQELVQPKAPKLPDPIRAMTNRPRFDVDTIFSLC